MPTRAAQKSRRTPAALARYSDEYLFCRTFNHAWQEATGIITVDEKVTGTWLTMRCSSCGTVRADVVSIRSGQLITRRYRYPETYRMAKLPAGQGTQKEQMRREFLARRG